MLNRVVPGTAWGKWSVGLGVGFLALIALSFLLAFSGQSGPGFNPVLASAMIPAGISAVGAFLAGLIGIIDARERSPLVMLFTAVGFLVTTFLIGEFLLPH